MVLVRSQLLSLSLFWARALPFAMPRSFALLLLVKHVAAQSLPACQIDITAGCQSCCGQANFDQSFCDSCRGYLDGTACCGANPPRIGGGGGISPCVIDMSAGCNSCCGAYNRAQSYCDSCRGYITGTTCCNTDPGSGDPPPPPVAADEARGGSWWLW